MVEVKPRSVFMMSAAKARQVAAESRLTVNDAELALKAAPGGVGVLFTDLGYATREIGTGRLVPLPERSTAILLYCSGR
jgi:hypothetical protein